MARTIAIWGPTNVATPTTKLRLKTTQATVAETITLTHVADGLYTGTVTAAGADYVFTFHTAGTKIGAGTITVSGTDGTTSYEDFAAAAGAAMTLTSGERDSIAAALLDLTSGIESGVTPRQAIRAIAAIVAGIISGAGTGTEVFKGVGQASGGTTRATVTVDSSGNRSAVVLP